MHFASLASLAFPILIVARAHAHPHPQIPIGNLKACEQEESTAAIVFNNDVNNPKCVVIGTASDLSSNPILAHQIAIASVSRGKDASANTVDPKKVVCALKKNNSSKKVGELTIARDMNLETTMKISGIECSLVA